MIDSARHNMDSAVEDHVSLTSSKLWKTGQKHWMKDMDWMYVVFLDYKKAFDSVPHRRLIEKLKSFGINGKLLKAR